MSSFEDSVRSVLADTMNLPPEFLDYMIQYQAVNPISSASAAGDLIASATRTSSLTSTATTFAAGADVLSTPLSFTCQGGNNYLLQIAARAMANNTAGDGVDLHINLDGADAGTFHLGISSTAAAYVPCNAVGVIVSPAGGSHTVNVRLLALTGGTATVYGGPGGSGAISPIYIALYRI